MACERVTAIWRLSDGRTWGTLSPAVLMHENQCR
jgi:hypothetical protein